MPRQIETDVFRDGQRGEQRAGLEDHGHAVAGGDVRRLNRPACDEDFALVRLFEADNLPEQNGLAAAAGTHDDENFPGVDVEIYAFEHFVSAVALAKPADGQAHSLLLWGISIHGVHKGLELTVLIIDSEITVTEVSIQSRGHQGEANLDGFTRLWKKSFEGFTGIGRFTDQTIPSDSVFDSSLTV